MFRKVPTTFGFTKKNQQTHTPGEIINICALVELACT